MMKTYRCEAATVRGFVQQIATSYLVHKYWFYVTGQVPDGKDPTAVDEKLIHRYSVGGTRWERSQRKSAGKSNIQYIRHGRFLVLMATKGDHLFFTHESGQIRNATREPLRYAGYSISVRQDAEQRWHSHVRMQRGKYLDIKRHMLSLAAQSAEEIEDRMWQLPFEPYAPIRRQVMNIWREVNRERKRLGLAPIRLERSVRMKRRVVRPFERTSEQREVPQQPVLSGKEELLTAQIAVQTAAVQLPEDMVGR